MTKLLNKPLKIFILFTCGILVCSIPAYFYLVQSIWIDELDDHNQQLKEQIQIRFDTSDSKELVEKIALWNQIQSTSRIFPSASSRKDSVYIMEREISDNGVMEFERFRGLSSSVSLNGKPYSLVIETNIEEVDETVLAISLITCLFMILLIVGFVLLNRRLSQQIWLPFTQTLEKLKQFDLNGSTTIYFSDTDILEFAELNNALLKLIDNNVRAYKQQKEFTQNASHELQTPLALLKTKIDLLIQDASLTTQQREIIESLDSSISRVTRINKNLLLLAGIENRQYESEQVNLSELVRFMVSNFSDSAEDKGCEILMNVHDNMNIRANESLMEILVSNLLSNTVRHGSTHSEITVTLTNKELVISNKGEVPLNEQNLFKRFISVAQGNPGTGLGLSIVKEISDKYGWRISYTFTENKHIFSLSF